MYKLFKQAIWDEHGRQLVNAVYTDDLTHPRSLYTEPCYDQDTPQSGYIKWWQCSTDEVLCDDREYKNFLLCQTIDEIVDGNNKRITLTPDKRNIVFNKRGELVLLCNDTEWFRIMKSYGSIENYLKTN
jgi:hypothetical protein